MGQSTVRQGSYVSFVTSQPRFNAIGNFVQKGVSSYDGLLSTSRQNGQDNVFSNNWQQPQQQENQGEQEQEPQRQPLVNFAPQQLPQQQRQERGPEQQQQQQQQEQEQQQRQSQEQQQQQERQSQEQQKQDGLSSPQDDPRPRDFTGLDDSQLHLVVHETCKLEKLGGRKKDGYGAWTLCTNHLRPGGIVYSFGIGGDVTFDNEMVNRGYKVFGFDPTVTPDHVSSLFKNNHERDQPSTFQFCQVGIGAVDGIITFFSPKNPRLKSMTAVKHEELSKRYESQGMPAPVMRLPTFMCTNGHGFIDVLKIDVEGVEFDICDEWLRMDTPLPVGQVLLEFHDRLLKDGKLRRKACLEVMAREGFTEVFVSRSMEEATYARMASRRNLSLLSASLAAVLLLAAASCAFARHKPASTVVPRLKCVKQLLKDYAKSVVIVKGLYLHWNITDAKDGIVAALEAKKGSGAEKGWLSVGWSGGKPGGRMMFPSDVIVGNHAVPPVVGSPAVKPTDVLAYSMMKDSLATIKRTSAVILSDTSVVSVSGGRIINAFQVHSQGRGWRGISGCLVRVGCHHQHDLGLLDYHCIQNPHQKGCLLG
ncbi:unnamed protein product [Closterium sp. NIES-53]